MAISVVGKNDFSAEVNNCKGVVLVDFFANWCGPCKMTGPIIDELAKEINEVKFVKIDVDKSPELAEEYSIFSIPSFLIFKNGNLVSQFSGASTKQRFMEEIKKAQQS